MTTSGRTPAFRIDHPDGPGSFAEYGVDRSGVWVTVHFRGVEDRYDASEPGYDSNRPILGALEYLVEWWFFSGAEVAETLSLLAYGQPVPRRLRALADVVEHLRVLTG